MIATKYTNKHSKVYEVYPFLNSLKEDGDMCRISVYQSDNFGEGFGKAEVNWPACGSQSTEYTNKFIEALQFAVSIASELNAGREPQDNKIVSI